MKKAICNSYGKCSECKFCNPEFNIDNWVPCPFVKSAQPVLK